MNDSSQVAACGERGEDLVEWMFMPLQRYAEFSGRSRRKEYWLFSLACVLVYSALGALLFVGGSDGGDITSMSGVVGLTFLALILAILVPSLAVQVRRFHDQDRSGWFI